VARTQQLVVPGRINPRTVQTELLGMRGKQLSRNEVKQWARETAQKLFGEALAELPIHGMRASGRTARQKQVPQDVIDALLIGAVAVARVQLSRSINSSLEAMFESRRQVPSRGGRRMNGWSAKDLAKLGHR
ncbi:MAG: hypothetical protein KDD69_11295, partial [Bdellovibrionales bacterium]|nr:hypothetical protein [Bdellovibrionales bacterium]